jgi:putative SOS response-associated peptidase YedK
MCGRYGFGNPARLGKLPLGVDLSLALPDLAPRWNVTPSQPVPLVRETPAGREALMARWGLVPFWADDPSIGNRLANARGDTVATKPAFRAAFKQRRGLMPADLFYEWQPLEGVKVKQPWCMRMPGDAPFAMAALWESWTPKDDRDASPLVTCCLITTEPNNTMQPIHDRMPVILDPADYEAWLDPATSTTTLQGLIRPYHGPMHAYPVSTHVNSPRFDDPECAVPLQLPD